MTAIQAPTHCLEGLGPSIYPERQSPCKICFVEISPDECSITHIQDPCYTAFHSECLKEWLPHAAHVANTFTNTDRKEPSCPNCRGSLGETNLTSDDGDGMEINAGNPPLVLAPYAYPVFSLDELREIVGDDAFTSLPLADRRYSRAIRFDEILIEQPAHAPAITAARTQQVDAGTDFPWLVEEGNFIPGDPRVDILSLFPPHGPVTQPTSNIRENAPPSPSTVKTLLHTNLDSLGITHYEAYHFPLPSLLNTTFYLPIPAYIEPLHSINALRSSIRSTRAYHDPTLNGRWLRNPRIYSTSAILLTLQLQRSTYLPDLVNEAICSLPDTLSLEGWALYLPSSILNFSLIYAVPVVKFDDTDPSSSSFSGIEEGEIITGLVRADGNVDTTQYWPSEPYSEDQARAYGADVDVLRQHETEIANYNRIFEMETLNARDGDDEDASLLREEEADSWLDWVSVAPNIDEEERHRLVDLDFWRGLMRDEFEGP